MQEYFYPFHFSVTVNMWLADVSLVGLLVLRGNELPSSRIQQTEPEVIGRMIISVVDQQVHATKQMNYDVKQTQTDIQTDQCTVRG
jgi:hypothetical protein